MSDYHDQAEMMGVPFGFNIDYEKTLLENVISKISEENRQLTLQLSIRDAKIHQLEGLAIELYNKVDRLINEADTGEDI